MKTLPIPSPGYHRTNLSSLALIGVVVALVALIGIPLFSSSSASSSKRAARISQPSAANEVHPAAVGSNRKGVVADQVAFLAASNSSVLALSTFRSLLPIPQPSLETINTFASDCTTPRTTFFLGETVCAKTAGVTETNRFVNWFGPNGHAFGGAGVTDITTDPQNFLYTPTVLGLWKATIADPSDSSIVPTDFTVVEPPPLATYADGCVIPKTTFVLGDKVCAKATGLVGYRFAWVDSAGFIRQRVDITTDPQTDTFTLPSDPTTVVNDTIVDNRGEWRVNAITSRGSLKSSAFFTVTDPANAAVDLSITKTLIGDSPVENGPAQFSVTIINNGPDDAVNAHFVDSTFTNATFNSITQTDGPAFTCTGAGVDCTLAQFPQGAEAKFLLNFTAGVAGGNLQNTATISSDTTELNTADNSFTTASVKVGSGTPPPTCILDCPDNINANADTEENNQRGTHVNYAAPTSSGTCGTVTTSPASGSFFPVGTTTVTATSTDGNGSCSFTVTVVDQGNPPTISCPINKEANADNDCVAIVSVGTATATGGANNTVIGTRSDGKLMYTCDANGTNCTRRSSDDPFPAGVTTITWIAYSHDVAGPYPDADFEELHRTGSDSCTQTVTVNDVTPPVITAQDQTVAADANCQATVPDYTNSVSDNCSCAANDNSQDCVGQHVITLTQDVPAGTVLGPGAYTIHLSANDGSSNNDGAGNTTNKTITFTVKDLTPPIIACPANITTNTEPGICSASVNPGTATATDNCDTNPTVAGTRSDNQPLNAPYPKGTTTITWTATDHASPANQSSCLQTITVQDHELPMISCPANITLEPTCPSGAIATYTAPVGTDNCPGATTARTAGLASGSVFPIGTTTVTHTVTDASGNTASCSFTVTVLTPQAVIQSLINSVNASSLTGTQKNGLLAKLNAALSAINSGQTAVACNKLSEFVNSVQTLISHGDLTAAQGNAWISSANHVRNTIGCTNLGCS